LRRIVVDRAQGRCEYCKLSQQGQEATFHIDHVIPVKEGGETTAENLALACVSCSLRKAARLRATDPETGTESVLFSPRRDSWDEHFHWEGVRLVARTARGRATVAALAMNRPLILAIRTEEALIGRHPPA
jgi:hypothetical protein